MSRTLYTKTGCPYCAAMREDLTARGAAWNEINVTDNPERIPELLKLTGGQRLVPVLVEDGKVVVAPRGG